jgi:hypothetical protein
MKMIDSRVVILTELKARVEVTFWPFRFSPNNLETGAAVSERQDAFEAGGIELRPPATRRGWVSDLQDLRATGLISLHGKTNATAMRLTSLGDSAVCRLTGNYQLAETWPLLGLVATLARESAASVLEDALLRRFRTGRNLAAVATTAVPLLANGFLTSTGDVDGHLAYAITDRGRAALSAGPPPPQADLPDYDAETADLFDDLFAEGLADRESWVPSRANLILVPHSAGDWPEMRDTARAKRFRLELVTLWGPENEPALEVSDEVAAGPPAPSITWPALLEKLGLDRPVLDAGTDTAAGDSVASDATPGDLDGQHAGPAAAEIVPPVIAESQGDA